jgi:hypothetical protein
MQYGESFKEAAVAPESDEGISQESSAAALLGYGKVKPIRLTLLSFVSCVMIARMNEIEAASYYDQRSLNSVPSRIQWLYSLVGALAQ